MKLLIQWTTDPPTDWVEHEITKAVDLRKLPDKGVPTGGEIIDSAPGWVAAVNLQGVIFDGWDHYHGDLVGTGLQVTVWNDDAADPSFTVYMAQQWTFLIPKHDPIIVGPNTDQLLTVYDDRTPSPYEGQTTSGGPVTVLPWSSFTPPDDAFVRHGINVEDAYWDQIRAARTTHGWREWV